MFEGFFYQMRASGVPVTPTAFLRLHKALAVGLITSLDDLYAIARALLIKQERYFDLYDQVFAAYFAGKEMDQGTTLALEEELERLLEQWLRDPDFLEQLAQQERASLENMTREQLVQYFLDRLKEQTQEHRGGSYWIGTGGTSPVGHGGIHPQGMRVGGMGRNRSAIAVAMDRRYIDYSDQTPLTAQQLGEALKSLRHLAPVGPADQLDLDGTIERTVRQGGEIELVFKRRLKDKLSVFLFIDNGGWSMTPYIGRTQALFTNARDTFRKLRTFFFHNCIYDRVWEDPRRTQKPVDLDEILRAEPDTRLIVVGDASMAPFELFQTRGALDWTTRQRRTGIDCLRELATRFSKSVWINPILSSRWDWTDGAYTIEMIREIFPMVDLTLAGIEKAVELLKAT
ncbi:MAG: hypothetical protein JW797_10310 [Bradymonadales bacterium]|nr:hypothetical protein [Bradymonadales bacterium]